MRLSDPDKQRIDAAVKAVEARTGAEIATAVVVKSDDYPEIPWKAFALGASLVALTRVLLAVFAPRWGAGSGAAVLADMTAILGGGAFLALLAIRSSSVGRLFVGHVRAEVEVRQHAEGLMFRRELFSTRDRNAVLILVSRFERQVVILPDRGVAAALPADALRAVIAKMAPLLRDGRACDALCVGVDEVGKLLPAAGARAGAEPGDGATRLPDAVIEDDHNEGPR
jgi:putative membrane protein